MNKEERFKYYASREWAVLKESVKERSGGKCERCGIGQHDQTHHETYERFGHEELNDLIAVCESCHEYLSGKSKVDPARVKYTDPGALFDGRYYGGESGNEWNVVCPVCEYDYTHIKEIRRDDGDLVIVFEGECGHQFELIIRQHKGINIVEVWRSSNINPMCV